MSSNVPAFSGGDSLMWLYAFATPAMQSAEFACLHLLITAMCNVAFGEIIQLHTTVICIQR
jgi:hypothetical protein